MSEKRFSVDYDEKANRVIYFDNGEPLTFLEVVDCLNEQQATIDKLQRYNDVLHDENLFNTMKMLEFMKEKGVFNEFYERIKKEVFGDE